jgi:hypothetical protein
MPLFLCTVHLLLYISFLKGYRPLLAPERFPGVRGSEFSNFTKKPSALFEIAKRPRKFIPHSNRVQMFCGQALDLKFISTRRSGNGRFTNAPASLLQKNPPTTLPPRLIPPNPNSPLTSRPARPSLLLLAATLSSHVVAPPRIIPVVTHPVHPPCSPPWARGGGSGLSAPPLRLPRIPRAVATLLSPSMPPLSTCFRFSMAAPPSVGGGSTFAWCVASPGPALPSLSSTHLRSGSHLHFLMGCYFRRARAGGRGTMTTPPSSAPSRSTTRAPTRSRVCFCTHPPDRCPLPLLRSQHAAPFHHC